MKQTIFSLWAVVCVVLLTSCAPKMPTGVFERTVLFSPGDAGSKYYRIPALVTAADGTLVAVADKRINSLWDLPNDIDVVCRRSSDLGRPWSEAIVVAGAETTVGYGDPAVVVDRRTGKMLCLMASGSGFWQSSAEDCQKLMLSVSSDNGLSWSAPRDITPQIYGPDCADEERSRWYGAFISSGNALQLSSGRIMAVLVTRTKPVRGDSISCYAIYSDDGGEQWSVSQVPGDRCGDEAKLVELENGDVLMSIRNPKHGYRRFSISHDQGVTWGETYFQEDLVEPACNGDLIRYRFAGRSFLLHSLPNDWDFRKNVSIIASYDEGKNWSVKRSLVPEVSGYSSLAQLPDGTVGCFVEEGDFEKGFVLSFYRFSLDWLEGAEE